MITVANNVSEKNVNQDHSVIKGSESKVTSLSACKGDPVKIDIDTSIKPVAQPHCRIPFHMRKLVENEIENLLKADIIERVDCPTSWVSPIVAVPKPNKPDRVRICVDMREANRAIRS